MEALQLRLNPAETTVSQASEGLSVEARMVGRYTELKAIRDRADEEMKDLSKTLLAHYNETGDRASNGTQEVSVSERTTYEWDDARLKDERPELFAMLAKVDPAKATALTKAKVVSADELDIYRKGNTTQVLTVRAVKQS